MEFGDLKGFGRKTIDMAMAGGADACDIIGASGKSFSLTAQAGEIDKFKVTSSNVLGLRIIKNQRVGISYTESLEAPAIEKMVKQAIEVSQFSGVDEFQSITIKNPQEFEEKNPSLFRQDDTPIEDKIELSLALEAEVLKRDKRAKNSPYNAYGDGESYSVYMNHLGTVCCHREKAFSCYTSVLTEEDGRQAVYGESMTGRTFKELDLNYCVDEALKHAIPLLKGKAVSTGKYDLIFSPDQLDQLISSFSNSFSGKMAKEGKSKFKDKLGQKVASPLLSMSDRPQFKEGFYYSSFDDEGVGRSDLVLLKKGILQNIYHNTATARYFNTKTTGHAARSARGAMGISGTHIVIDPGQTPEDAVLQGDYIEVIGLKGLHSGSNPISGQFSLAIDGIFYKNGELAQYVRDVTISGNFFNLLEGVVAVGDKVHSNSSKTFFTPVIRFADISVAG